MILKNVPFFKQKTSYTCGPASLKIVFAYWNKKISESRLAKLCGCAGRNFYINNNVLLEVVEELGFIGKKKNRATFNDLKNAIKSEHPVIINYLDNGIGHFSVVIGFDTVSLKVIDTYTGRLAAFKIKDFYKIWKGGDGLTIRWMLVIEPKK